MTTDRRDGAGMSAAFLLTKVGFAASSQFAQRLAAIGLEPRHVGLLHAIAGNEGQSQQAIGEQLHIPPSRMVAFVDDLEQRGAVERRPNPADRRAHSLYLTAAGRALLDKVRQISADHEKELLGVLDPQEREQLVALLTKLAAQQDVPLGVHPGLAAGGPPFPAAGAR